MYGAEYVARILIDLGIQVSESTVCRSLKYIRQTWKKKTRSAYRKHTNANLQRTADFLVWQGERDGSKIIYADEMGVRAENAERRFARSTAGTKAVKPGASAQTGERGTKHNFLGALSTTHGMLDISFPVVGKVDHRIFEEWCEIMLIPEMLEVFPLGGASVIMDNASFHRRLVLEEMFNAAGIELKFLPAYSPEYNPIETAFAWVKARIRQNPTESIRNIPLATTRAFQAITGDLATSWAKHSGYRL
jgi:hypothetical protein